MPQAHHCSRNSEEEADGLQLRFWYPIVAGSCWDHGKPCQRDLATREKGKGGGAHHCSRSGERGGPEGSMKRMVGRVVVGHGNGIKCGQVRCRGWHKAAKL